MPTEEVNQANDVSKVAKDLSSMPFGSMIGGPLSACIDAQEQAATSTVNFIRSVGFSKENPDEVVNVSFKYKRDDKYVELTVPLLTIVPIPFIAIDTVNISFKANLKSVDSEVRNEKDTSTDYTAGSSSYRGLGNYCASRHRSVMYGSVSNKKDSVATQKSTYSVEATIDINVVAHQESMPAGLSKVLEMLNQAIFLKDVEPSDVVKEKDKEKEKEK